MSREDTSAKFGRCIGRVRLLSSACAAYSCLLASCGKQSAPEALASDVADDWISVAGAGTLTLDQDKRVATLTVDAPDGTTLESTGSWSTTDSTVIIDIQGKAGALVATFGLKQTPGVTFLAPVPCTDALLRDCFERVDQPESSDDSADGPFSGP